MSEIYKVTITKEALIKAFKDEDSFYKYLDDICDEIFNHYYNSNLDLNDFIVETKRPQE